jgi:hypothetical protein
MHIISWADHTKFTIQWHSTYFFAGALGSGAANPPMAKYLFDVDEAIIESLAN